MLATDAARAAFAIGYAQANPTGDLHPRAVTACAAAIEASRLHPHAQIVEVTLHLGHLEGTWATIYDRRLAMIHQAADAARPAWKAGGARIDWATLVTNVRRKHGLTETTVHPDPVIAMMVNDAIAQGFNPDELTQLIADGLPLAHAEGTAGALALAADHAGYTSFDFDIAFEDALTALRAMDRVGSTFWDDQAKAWIEDAIRGSANDLTRELAKLIEDQASYADMLDSVSTMFDTGDAAAYVTDVAISSSLTQGALSLYGSEGVAQVDYLTAGDERVCLQCDSAESGNPYDLSAVPAPPLHGRCRCAVQATDNSTIPPGSYASYIEGDDGS